MLPELPQELVDYILDFVHDDRDALANCSLVCKAWMPSSTNHLFDKLRTRLVGPPGASSGLMDFYCLPSYPRVASHIRELHVTGHGTMFIEIACIRDILLSLPRLRNLYFEDIGFILKGPRVTEPVPRPALASLHLLNPTFTAPIRYLIASFDSIHAVHVVRYRVLTRSSQPPWAPDIDAAQPRTRVRKLTTQACNSEGTRILLGELEQCAASDALVDVALKGYSPYASLVPSVDRFLIAFPAVRRLALLISQHGAIDTNVDDAADGLAFTALASCAALESIHLSMPMVYHPLKASHNRAVWTSCMRLLRSAPITVRTLRIDVECGLQLVKTRRSTAAEYFGMLDWNLFNTVLEDLGALESIELWLGERPWNIGAGSEVEQALSPRAKRLLAGMRKEQTE